MLRIIHGMPSRLVSFVRMFIRCMRAAESIDPAVPMLWMLHVEITNTDMLVYLDNDESRGIGISRRITSPARHMTALIGGPLPEGGRNAYLSCSGPVVLPDV